MKTEFEVKFFPVDKKTIRKKLDKLDAELVLPESLMKIALFGNESNKDMKVHYLRVRDEKRKVTLSAKVHAREGEQIQDQKECEVIVENFEDTIEILKLAGLTMDYEQEKYREVWEYKDAEIVIDTWPGIEPLIEIEAGSESIVKQVAQDLGFDWEKRIVTSISEILMDVRKLSLDEALKFTKNWKFN